MKVQTSVYQGVNDRFEYVDHEIIFPQLVSLTTTRYNECAVYEKDYAKTL
jgi:hypothetical protein